MNVAPIIATYLIETPLAVEQAAEMIAGEQSSGTFLPIPGETEELKARARAQVVGVELLESVDQPSLRGARIRPSADGKQKFQRAEIRIAFPFDNIGCNIPTLAATVCGNLFELAEHSGCKLLDLELPDVFATRYPGPQFGVEGTRRLTGVKDRPIIGTIVKPSVGLSPEQTADLVRELGEAGIDFIKDDELMADPPHSPLVKRVECVMREINRLAERSGRKIMYAFNISDEVDAMRRHHDCVVKAGGTCVMVSLNHVGWAGVSALRSTCQVPIHGHRNGWGMLTRHPLLGIEFAAYQKLWRAIGVDHLHVNGLQNKFWEPDDSVVRSIESMQRPMWGGYHAMPVISSGQWGGQAPETLRRTRTQDVIYVAGGGIMAHPSGPAAGLRGIQQSWEAAAKGIALDEYAAHHIELRQTIAKFGRRS
ncbi:MAG: ribulose-bisphosphate carboxylase large subunit family protein [Pirellula sp.]